MIGDQNAVWKESRDATDRHQFKGIILDARF